MADGDALDPEDYNAPSGTATLMGIGQNSDLANWYRSLPPDAMANLLHNPSGAAADLSAAGISPPNPNDIHDANDAAGTPSRSARFDTTPASTFDQTSQGTGKTDRLPLIPGTSQAAPQAAPLPPGFQPPQTPQVPGSSLMPQGDQTGPEAGQPTIPKPPVTPPKGPVVSTGGQSGSYPAPPTPEGQWPQPPRKGPSIWPMQPRPDTPTLPGGVVYSQTSPTGYVDAKTGEPVSVDPSGVKKPAQTIIDSLPKQVGAPPALADRGPAAAAPASAVASKPPTLFTPPGAKQGPVQTASADDNKPPGTALDIATDEAKKEADEDTKRKEKVNKAISDLGKAMQGVKAPPPLSPPNIGAPTVRGTQSAGMSPIASLLQSLSRTSTGQVPPSMMPVLKLLGRA